MNLSIGPNMFRERLAHHMNLSIGPNKFKKRSACHMNLSIKPNMFSQICFKKRSVHHMNFNIEPNIFQKRSAHHMNLSIGPNMFQKRSAHHLNLFLDSVRPGECGEISGDAGGCALAGDHGEDQARPERGHARLGRHPLPPGSSRGVPQQA